MLQDKQQVSRRNPVAGSLCLMEAVCACPFIGQYKIYAGAISGWSFPATILDRSYRGLCGRMMGFAMVALRVKRRHLYLLDLKMFARANTQYPDARCGLDRSSG